MSKTKTKDNTIRKDLRTLTKCKWTHKLDYTALLMHHIHRTYYVILLPSRVADVTIQSSRELTPRSHTAGSVSCSVPCGSGEPAQIQGHSFDCCFWLNSHGLGFWLSSKQLSIYFLKLFCCLLTAILIVRLPIFTTGQQHVLKKAHEGAMFSPSFQQ